jgi:hypothetical protein
MFSVIVTRQLAEKNPTNRDRSEKNIEKTTYMWDVSYRQHDETPKLHDVAR